MKFLKLSGDARNIAAALALLTISSQSASAEALVLLCKGTSHCSTCRESEKQVHFDWTYTIDLSARTVDGIPATISDQRIAWQIKSATVLDEREISRYSKRFHYAGKPLSGGAEIYYGDGICEPQKAKAF
jgi:hypothetical protein